MNRNACVPGSLYRTCSSMRTCDWFVSITIPWMSDLPT